MIYRRKGRNVKFSAKFQEIQQRKRLHLQTRMKIEEMQDLSLPEQCR